MPKQIVAYLFCVFLVGAFCSAACAELLSSGLESDELAFVSGDDADTAPALDHTPAALQRTPRAQAMMRISSAAAPMHAPCLRDRKQNVFDSPPLSRPELYQQISVYRL